MCVHAKLHQFCLTLCDPVDYSPPVFSVHRVLQARIWEWAPCPSPGALLYPGIKPAIFLCLQHWQMCSVPLSYLWTPRTTSAKGNQLQSQWKMEVNIRVDTTILIHPQNVHSISFMRVDDNFVLLVMKDTPYNEIEFPPLNATLRQFSLYFPEMQPESELKDCPY